MKRPVLLVVAILVLSFTSYAQNSELEGEWVSMSARTRGITKMVITAKVEGYSVEAWGRCHPSDCAWGRTSLTRVGTSVEDDSFKTGFAIWEPGFATKYVILSCERQLLRVETVTVFKGRSRRSSYRVVEYLRRPQDAIE